MSYVIAAPELMAAAATDLAAIGETLNAAHLTAAPPTVAVLPAAADEVSASIAHLMSGYGQQYQALAGNAAAFHDQFVATLKTSIGSYSATEAAAAASLQPAAATTPPVLNLVSQLLAQPELIPVFLFALGFIGLVAIYATVMYSLDMLGLLG